MSETLKPCPFCGGRNVIINNAWKCGHPAYRAICLNPDCGCMTVRCWDTKREAADAWNKRYYDNNA